MKGERWAAIQFIPMQVWEDAPLREPSLLEAQIATEWLAEEADVELDHESWQIIEPASLNGEYIQFTDDDGRPLPNGMLVRVEGTGR